MKLKTILFILAFIILGIMIWLAYVNFFDETANTNELANLTEITPKEEITEEQERQTMVSLYYTNTETNTLMPEARVIDAKDLLENPYKTLLSYLIESPKNEKLKSSIPEGTKVNDVVLNGDVAVINLSKEFTNEQNEEKIKLAIYSMANTLTELNEVEAVKILIDGEENMKIDSTDIVLSDRYERQNNEQML